MKGLLLLNLGTPRSPSTRDVRAYLREFLMDPLVIDIPAFWRRLLVHGIIAPFRAPRSARAYGSIWTSSGSPLLLNMLELTQKLSQELPETSVQMAMRYGEPSIFSALKTLKEKSVSSLQVLPLYPQYAESSVRSCVEEVKKQIQNLDFSPSLEIIPPFYDHPAFIKSLVDVSLPYLKEFNPDHLLLSYHGLPERQVKKTDRSGEHCLASPQCCEKMGEANRDCYRAQCIQTSLALASALQIQRNEYSISFQSRLGRTPWISPFTDKVIPELAQKGVKRLAVMCPSFVSDCLETLEEIGIRGRELFLQSGGEDLKLIPCLNASPAWVNRIMKVLDKNTCT